MTDPRGSSPPAGMAATGASVEATLQDVWTRMRPTVLARVDALDEAVAALLEHRLDEPARAEAERIAHKLAGSAGTFGFPDATRLARGLEHRFAAGPAVNDAPAAAAEVGALRRVLDTEDSHGPEAPEPTSEAPSAASPSRDVSRAVVLVLTPDDALAERLHRAGGARNLAVRAAATPPQARQALAAGSPAAVVLDSRFAASTATDAEAAEAVAALAALPLLDDVPMLLLADADEQPDRVAAARAGVDSFLPRAADADEVAATIRERLDTTEVARVLACDDDVAVLEAVKAVLARPGLVVDTVGDPHRFWETLAATRPDLVLLDLSMPDVDGLELCRTLRSDPNHVAVPVVFLTAHSDRSSVREAFAAGADDVVGKPIVDAELRVRVDNRLERARLLRRLAQTDPLTGLDTRRASLPALQRLLALARRHDQPLSLAVVRVAGLTEIVRAHGHAAGDAVLRDLGRRLRDRFRTSDVTARWGEEELLVGMYGAARDDAVGVLAELSQELRAARFVGDAGEFAASFNAGVAEHPADGDDLDALLRVAERALEVATRAGGTQVRTLRPGEGDETLGLCDVAVVDDDPALTELVSHALRTHGYEVVVVSDGGEARDRLVGEAADLHPRLVLLDVELPALNGLDLLAEFGRRELLARTRVIMLTGRAGEQEVVDALRLGATDHVAKPFSVPELVERVRRVLAA